MSIVIACNTGDLGIDDIFRLVTAISATGDVYIRLYDDGTDPGDLSDLVDCESGDISMLDILRGALVIIDDEYALNVVSL